MRFHDRQHRHYCGIDLHVKTMYVCILDAVGQVLVHRNVKTTPEAFLEIVAPYRDDLVVESLRLSPFATRRLSLNRCWVQRPHRGCTSAGNEDSTEGERDLASIQRSRLDFRRLGF